MNKLIVVVVVFVFINCSFRDTKLNEKNNVINYNISNGITENANLNLSSIADDIITVALETTEDCSLGAIRETRITDQYILVRDDFQQVFLFTIDGKFIREVGKKGKGPGEYTQATK
ncbi:MAG: 6-bladed beta-propeller, partial [bacterium]